MKKITVLHITQTAVIAALYAALTLALAPIEFGSVQFRISEALTILPVFTPWAIPGLVVGCVLSNGLGAMLGLNPAGILDIFVGSGASLLAALCTYACRNVRLKGLPVLSAFFPVLFNTLIVGIELSLVLHLPLLLTMAGVFVGELVICYALGLPLFVLLNRNGLARKLWNQKAPASKGGGQ